MFRAEDSAWDCQKTQFAQGEPSGAAEGQVEGGPGDTGGEGEAELGGFGESNDDGEFRKSRTIRVALGQKDCGAEGLFSLVGGDVGEGAGAQPPIKPADAHVELRFRFCKGLTRSSPGSDSCTSRWRLNGLGVSLFIGREDFEKEGGNLRAG